MENIKNISNNREESYSEETAKAIDKKAEGHEISYAVMRYENKKKSKFIAYLLWLFLGFFGGHRVYLRYYRTALIFPAVLLFLYLLGGIDITLMEQTNEPGKFRLFEISGEWSWFVVIMWLADAFLIPLMVRVINNELIEELTTK